jgi:hypothetical protein
MGFRTLARVAVLTLCLLAGCTRHYFEEPQLQGPVGLVKTGDAHRLWLLHRQTEERYVSFQSGRGRGSTMHNRKDTYFHFEVMAFDPTSVRPLWTQRLLTYGDPDLQPYQRTPSRVVGSAVSGRLLGQDGDLLWLLVDEHPFALDADTGERVHDSESIIRTHPQLADLLPSEARFWGFDRGPVATLADARQVRLSGRDLTLEDYLPTPQPQESAPLKANGMPKVVPTRPLVPMVRHVPRGEGEWLALYTEREAADALEDSFGDHAAYPFSILDEGGLARRSFHRVHLELTRRFDETYLRIAAVEPVPDSPVLLRGRFVRDPFTDAAVDPGNGDLLVWHRSRVDNAGRLMLSRLGPDLQPRWQAELPMSDGGTDLPVYTWRIGNHLVVQGMLQVEKDEVHTRAPHLASVSLEDGSVSAWNLAAGAPPGEEAQWPRYD